MDILNNINTMQITFWGASGILKALFLVVIFGYVIYTILLTLRVRILADTVKTPSNKIARILAYLHLLIAVVGSFFAVILILLG
jgi:TRAP-type C4-dicarboxylate transport system permease small subunit